MTRIKSLVAGLVVTAIAAVVPAANAVPTPHVIGAGSSAQFLGTMIGMSQLAINNLASGQCIYHWTKKNALNAHDNRDSLGRILDETGNVGIVWDAACSDGTGNTNITDIWLDGQYDSTLGVRLFSAQQKAPTAGAGATVYITVIAGTGSDNLVNPANLWADNAADVALPANLLAAIGAASPGNYHVNMGLTDIRPEDALAATTRAKSALNTTTYSGLGYQGPTGQIGAPIFTAQAGSGSNFTPIGFGLSGAADPITGGGVTVPAYTTIPVGAAPIVFAYNHTGNANPVVTNLVTGVKGDGTGNIAGSYKLANLFDGTSSCDTDSTAFGGNGDGLGLAVNLILREPLSGTMNTTEYSLFRTTGNTNDSQEKGVINPTRAPYNPLNLNCPNKGNRQRRIGTGQVLTAINGTANTLGYFFFSFANSATVDGTAANAPNYNYLDVDGVDPLGLGTPNQELPFCSATLCPASQWPGSISFPSLRDGTYKAWSLYRWTNYNSNSDPLGPAALATSMQDNIDSTVADFVPFVTSTNADGLTVYHSHFTQSGKTGNNGPASPTETLTTPNGNSLGGGTEAGGDEGGVIVGWDHSTVTVSAGTGSNAGHRKVMKTAGRGFGFSFQDATHNATQAALLMVGQTVTINGTDWVVAGAPATTNPTSTTLYLTTNTAALGAGQAFSTYIAPTAPGYVNHKQ